MELCRLTTRTSLTNGRAARGISWEINQYECDCAPSALREYAPLFLRPGFEFRAVGA